MSATATAPAPNPVGRPPADAERRSPPPKIVHPLHVGNVCLFYPQGVKAPGEARVAVMISRNNHEHVDLQFLDGNCKYAVRHIEDPFFKARSQRLADGAWDYAEGTAYDFPVPGRLRFPDQVIDRVITLHAEGKTPAEISMAVAVRGLTADAVSRLIRDFT